MTDADFTRRELFGAGAASFGALALGADQAAAADPAASPDNAVLGGAPARLVETFPELVPPAVPGATMATRTCHHAIAYNANSSSSELTWISTGVDSVWNPSVNGAVMCPLDIPVGSRLVRIDYYGYRATAGTQSWTLIRFDATTGRSTFPHFVVSASTSGLIQTSAVGIDIAVEPGIQYIADLIFTSADNAFVSAVYQYIPAPTGLLFHPLTPFRAYDSRWAGAGGPILANTSRTISVKDAHNTDTGAVTTADLVPASAQAISYNLTITGTAGFGFLAITPGGAATFGASAINWSGPGQDLANGGNVGVNAARGVEVFAGFTGSTQFIVDVTGYYA